MPPPSGAPQSHPAWPHGPQGPESHSGRASRASEPRGPERGRRATRPATHRAQHGTHGATRAQASSAGQAPSHGAGAQPAARSGPRGAGEQRREGGRLGRRRRRQSQSQSQSQSQAHTPQPCLTHTNSLPNRHTTEAQASPRSRGAGGLGRAPPRHLGVVSRRPDTGPHVPTSEPQKPQTALPRLGSLKHPSGSQAPRPRAQGPGPRAQGHQNRPAGPKTVTHGRGWASTLGWAARLIRTHHCAVLAAWLKPAMCQRRAHTGAGRPPHQASAKILSVTSARDIAASWPAA